jgi:membrane-associated phospholipid phosphatase
MLATLESIDIAALNFIRANFYLDAPWFTSFVLFFSDLQPLVFSLFLIGLWFYGLSIKNNGPKHVALDLFWHVLGAFALYWVLNTLLPVRPRPELFTSLPPLIDHLPDNSFPSGHAIFW